GASPAGCREAGKRADGPPRCPGSPEARDRRAAESSRVSCFAKGSARVRKEDVFERHGRNRQVKNLVPLLLEPLDRESSQSLARFALKLHDRRQDRSPVGGAKPHDRLTVR